MKPPEKCPTCEGCGRIANSDHGESWTLWERLPEASKVAVRLGLIKPIPCPTCKGSGNAPEPEGEAGPWADSAPGPDGESRPYNPEHG